MARVVCRHSTAFRDGHKTAVSTLEGRFSDFIRKCIIFVTHKHSYYAFRVAVFGTSCQNSV